MKKLLFTLVLLFAGCTNNECVEIIKQVKGIDTVYEVYKGGELLLEFTKENTDSLSLETLELIYSETQSTKTQ